MLVLAVVVAVSACRRAAPPPTVTAVSEAELATFVKDLEAAMIPCDGKRIDALIDTQTLGEITVAGLPNSRSVLAGMLNKLRAVGFGAQYCGPANDPNTLRHLGTLERNGEKWPLFRALATGVNYHAFRPSKGKDGKVRIVDMFTFTAGMETSAAMRSMVDVLMDSAPTKVAKLDAPLDKLRVATLAGNQDEALRIIASLPPELQRSKPVMIQKVSLSASLPEADYQKAIDEYAATFPGDPSLDLMTIDGYWMKKDYPNALAAIDRLDRAVGGDPYLESLRSVLHGESGDLAKAVHHAQQATTREPELEQMWWLRLNVHLQQKDIAQSMAVITELEKRFEVTMSEENMAKEEHYAFLLASPEWKQHRAARAE
jgi:hypothetical protein